MSAFRASRFPVVLLVVALVALAVPVGIASAKVVVPPDETAQRIGVLGHAGSSAKGTFTYGDVLYTVGSAGLQIYDIAAPDDPVKLGEALFSGGRQVVADGEYAFVAVPSGTLLAFDVSDPAEPVKVGEIAGVVGSMSSQDALAIAGDAVFVAGTNEVTMVDVSDPAAMTAGTPFLTGDMGGNWMIDVEGTRLVGVTGSTIAVVDITDPSAPGAPSLLSVTNLQPGGIDLLGGELYVGTYSTTYGFAAFDCSSGTPVFDDGVVQPGHYFESVAVDLGGTAHVLTDDYGLATFDVSDPADISYLDADYIQAGGDMTDVALDPSGDYPYAGDWQRGLYVFDCTVPATVAFGPAHLGAEHGYDVVVSGDTAFVADQQTGVLAYDVSDFANPTYVGTTYLAGAQGLGVAGDTLVVACPSTGQLRTLDVSDPHGPILADFVTVGASSYGDDVAIVGDRAYVVAGSAVRVVDITDPYDIAVVGSWDGSYQFSAIDAVGTRAVVGSVEGWAAMLDISTDTPAQVGSGVGTWGMVNEVAMYGDRCILATDGTYKLLQLPMSAAGGLGGIDVYGTGGAAKDVTVAGGRLFVTGDLTAGSGIGAWPIPLTPPVAWWGPLPNPYGVAVTDAGIVAVGEYSGVYTLSMPDFTGPTVTVGGVTDGGVYSGPVTPVVTFGADAENSEIRLNGAPWIESAISEPGAYTIGAWAEDEWGNETDVGPIEFRILTGAAARLAGTSRYDTSAKISAATFKSAGTVVIATGRNYPDALAAAPLAYELDAPVLLVDAGKVPAPVSAEIDRLGATKAIIVGGTAAVPDSIKTQLAAAGIPAGSVERIAGTNRFATARLIAEKLRALAGAPLAKAYIATGETYPDALAAGGLAARERAPILLVNAAGVPADTAAAIASCGVTKTVVLGGALAVPNAVMAALPSATRLSGANRYETCRLIAEASLAAGFDESGVYLATGANFPDALSAAAASAQTGAPILLVASPLPAAAVTYANDHDDALWNVMPVGGGTVVADSVVTAFKELLK